MSDGMKRREFLRLTGTFFAAATLSGVACGGDDAPTPDAGTDAPTTGVIDFPQGLASGDPRETSVVLWTRAVRTAGGSEPISLTVEVASDAAFTTIVVQQTVQALAAVDHTVRVVVTGLAADTIYYYRFVAGLDSISGRTRTAPAAGADVPIRLGWVSCQDYGAGHYGAYRLMVQEDMARAEADQIRAVLHLGDFIYETRGGRFQVPLDENLEPITLAGREVPAFPSGGGNAGGNNFANTVDDFRHLYKVFGSDPDLKAARARWPFIHIWDDHEFSNDCWQSMGNYTDPQTVDEPSQRRKLAANQAWFEYLPVQLTGAPGVTGVTQHASDFATATVSDAAFTPANSDNFVDEANNAAAVGSMTIYRSLRFGRHVELVMTDQRSYRSDHAVPEEFANNASSLEYLDERNVLPAADVATMDAGNTANGGNPPATVGFNGLPNPRMTSPPGTMLGKEQKTWWKETMKASDATWKIWGNEVPLMRFFIKEGGIGLIVDRIMNGDAWDGYPTERKELMSYLRAENIRNVVVLTGDIHAQFAGIVHDDYLAASPNPVAVEFAAAGISSNSVFSFFEDAARGNVPPDVRGVVTYSAAASGGPAFVENLNLLLLHGTAAAHRMHQTNNLTMAMALADDSNPHLKYADTNSQGYGVALITATQVEATLTTVERPVTTAAPAVKRTARFVVPVNNPAGLTGPTFTGTPPFPFPTT